MLPKETQVQYGFERENGLEDVKCIIIHNTSSNLSAKEIEDYLRDECLTSQGCSYVCDHNEVRQIMPDDWGVYNTGNGKDYSAMYGIAIEICSNNDDSLYFEGEAKAIELIKELMNKYNIPRSEIYFHSDFSPRVYCPADILRIYKTKKNFLDTFIN